ncbi:hypothetical protein BOTBODRAFT_288764 [Botryobasidium botryosum FD-172 SS1]|uniref:Uncharacterized protein n=1 Tax=Botryobasidium botryosum (strain FD-172 SS1) TaxID=930990 RepID=A0A067LS66_BOTB1|nr:hypothetical protein BOTBODRAFT_288764 [Botryobasidium botryosum FD-172 SS1]
MIKPSTRSQALTIPLWQRLIDVNTKGRAVATGNTASVQKVKVSSHAYIGPSSSATSAPVAPIAPPVFYYYQTHLDPLSSKLL